MVQPLGYLKETASQTAGPYVHIGLVPRQAGFEVFKNNFGEAMLGPKTKGERIIIEGQVIDGAGAPLRDALIEIWQANAAGRYNHPADRQNKPIDEDFRGWGRAGCDFESGRYRFRTIKPGAVVGRSGYRPMAPHVNLWIVARGINIGLVHACTFPTKRWPMLRIRCSTSSSRRRGGNSDRPAADARSGCPLLLRYSSARRAGDRLFDV